MQSPLALSCVGLKSRSEGANLGKWGEGWVTIFCLWIGHREASLMPQCLKAKHDPTLD